MTQPILNDSLPRSDNSSHSKSGMSDSSRRFLYPEEVEKLIKAAKSGRNGTRDSLMILMAYRHGLRVSELLSLKWNDIDWKTPQVFIKRTKGSNDSMQPLYPDECRALKIVQKGVKQKEVERGFPIPYVFCSEQARKMDNSTFRKLLYSLSEDWEFRVHPHMLRHSTGYKLANEGRDLRVIQNYLGHKNISNTVRYTQLSSKQFDGLWD